METNPDPLTEAQQVARRALRRLADAYAKGRGFRLTADEVDALATQTVIGEIASRAEDDSR